MKRTIAVQRPTVLIKLKRYKCYKDHVLNSLSANMASASLGEKPGALPES